MTCPALHIIAGTMGTTETGESITPRHVTVTGWDGDTLRTVCVHCRATVTPGPGTVGQDELRRPR